MLAIAKVLVLAFVVSGAGTTGLAASAVNEPLTNAIEIHEDHLTDPDMPDQAIKGQQNAYDHLMKNHERWLAKHPAMGHGGPGGNDDSEVPADED